MKRIPLFLFALLLTACGSSYSVADSQILDDYPELEGAVIAWQAMVDATDAKDCTAFLDNMRLTLKLTEEVCPAAFEYFTEAPTVDWARSEWSSTGGKVKLYSVEGGSIASFIYNEANGSWRSDEKFWE